MADWLDASEQWPRHKGCKEWNEALALARAKGWSLRSLEGHRWGMIVCRRTADGDCCKLTIDRSASGTESVARNALLMIERCPHLVDESASGRLSTVEASRQLERVDQLIRSARRCLLGRRKLRAADDLLEVALEQLDELDRATDLESEGLEMIQDSVAIARQVGVDMMSNADGLLRAVDGNPAVSEAERLLSEVEVSSGADASWTAIRNRAVQLREEIREMAAAVKTLANSDHEE